MRFETVPVAEPVLVPGHPLFGEARSCLGGQLGHPGLGKTTAVFLRFGQRSLSRAHTTMNKDNRSKPRALDAKEYSSRVSQAHAVALELLCKALSIHPLNVVQVSPTTEMPKSAANLAQKKARLVLRHMARRTMTTT